MTKLFTRLILPLIVILIIPLQVVAKDPIRTIEGIVVNVSDGDTFNVQDSLGTKVKVRVYGIDAPETEKVSRKTGKVIKPGQPYGEEAWMALKGKVIRQHVKLDVMDIDKYKRPVCIVHLNGRVINQEMIVEGWAWAYRKYLSTPYASVYINEEEQARSKRFGLWQQNNPEPPWEFRKRMKKSMRNQVW